MAESRAELEALLQEAEQHLDQAQKGTASAAFGVAVAKAAAEKKAKSTIRVDMNEDGTANVHIGNTVEVWQWDQLQTAEWASAVCCEIRRGLRDRCPCLACEITKVFVPWGAQHGAAPSVDMWRERVRAAYAEQHAALEEKYGE